MLCLSVALPASLLCVARGLLSHDIRPLWSFCDAHYFVRFSLIYFYLAFNTDMAAKIRIKLVASYAAEFSAELLRVVPSSFERSSCGQQPTVARGFISLFEITVLKLCCLTVLQHLTGTPVRGRFRNYPGSPSKSTATSAMKQAEKALSTH